MKIQESKLRGWERFISKFKFVALLGGAIEFMIGLSYLTGYSVGLEALLAAIIGLPLIFGGVVAVIPALILCYSSGRYKKTGAVLGIVVNLISLSIGLSLVPSVVVWDWQTKIITTISILPPISLIVASILYLLKRI